MLVSVGVCSVHPRPIDPTRATMLCWRILFMVALLALSVPLTVPRAEAARTRLFEPVSGRLQRLRQAALLQQAEVDSLDASFKHTPGPQCMEAKSCAECAEMHFCDWLPDQTECVPAGSVEGALSKVGCQRSLSHKPFTHTPSFGVSCVAPANGSQQRRL